LKFTRETSTSLTIRSVSNGKICIGDTTYDRTITLTTRSIVGKWSKKAVAELNEGDFAALLEEAPEVIIVGTGATNIFPPRELVFAMARRGVGLEVMDTTAAARTFNVLVAEDRQVAAVFYL
jgi:uncharacterized protein